MNKYKAITLHKVWGGKGLKSNKLLEYISGYVNIVIEGYYIEQFINICNNKQIDLWNIKKENSLKVFASIYIKDFKKLK